MQKRGSAATLDATATERVRDARAAVVSLPKGEVC